MFSIMMVIQFFSGEADFSFGILTSSDLFPSVMDMVALK